MKFLDDIVYFAGGLVDDSTWRTSDWYIIDGAYGDSGDPKKRTRISNVFYIDYKWSF
ncbi:MAG: hypothetical protein LBH07_08715 [Treponema sp.]|jgi:hypothetical protein|nr:hypothetical protein [Treponema sp.]